MPRKISNSKCIRPECIEDAVFRRLCSVHHKLEHPSEVVMEYCFTWNITEKFEGKIRASSEAEAWRLAHAGVIAGNKTQIGQPSHVELIGAVTK